jgi:uncharacterized membrane protein YesL
MNPHESSLYRALEVFSSLLLLNVLWILACLPVITVYPATAAMFGVVGEWVREDERGVVRRYVALLKRDFAQSFGIGIIWTLLGVIVGTGVLEIRHMAPVLAIPAVLVLSFVGIAYLATTMFLFPVMVTYDLRWTRVLKNSLLIAMSFPLITLLCLVVIAGAGLIAFTIPISLVILVSVTSYVISWLCHRAFERVIVPPQGP